jgi:NADPH:quinone reductase-like Zn-dependent oxidoreductase
MKAVAFSHSRPVSDPDSLLDIELPEPQPRHRDLLVEVRAVSVNPVDTKIRRFGEPLGEYRVLGYDAAGIVRGVGPEVTNFGLGDEVYYAGVVGRPGSNAEFQLVDDRIVGRKPRTLSFAEAAALPLTALTAWEMLFDRFKIPRDQTMAGNLLIVGGAGGVGSIAIDWCKTMGAHHVINHHQDMAAQFSQLGLEPPEYIFCAGHAEAHWSALTQLVAPEGAIGIIEGGKPLDFSVLMRKCVAVHTEYMFARGMLHTKTMAAQHRTLEALAHLIDNGTLRGTMTENFGTINAENLKRAHAAVESHSVRGKIVLEGF